MKKFILITTTTLVVIFALLLATPFLFKDKILAIIKEQANNNINAKVYFDNDINLSLIKNFPNFTIGINNVAVMGINEFEGDTLISWQNFEATVDVMSVIKGKQILINKIFLNKPNINAIVLSNGKANWDITKTDTTASIEVTDTSSSAFKLSLKQLVIEQANINYNDAVEQMSAQILDWGLNLKGDFTQDDFLLEIRSQIQSLSFAYGGVKYLNKVNTGIKVDLDMNLPNMKFIFKENEIALNALKFKFDGNVEMPDSNIKMDLKYSANQATFKDFISLVPGIYTSSFQNIQTSGNLAFNGFAKGVYNAQSLPAFAFNLMVNNARLKYPDLPAEVKDIEVKLNITNPDGNINNTEINLSKFHLSINGDAVDAKLIAKNVIENPHVDAWIKGKVNLDNVSKIVPIENGMTVKGIVTSDVTAIGYISDIEKENYAAFNASGQIMAQNVYFKSNDLPEPFLLNQMQLSLNPKQIILQSFDSKIGKSDIKLNGEILGFLPYLFSDGIISGKLSLASNHLDANQLMASESATTAPTVEDTTSMHAPEIPANINFKFNCNIKQLLYSNYDITNFNGILSVENQKLNLENISLNMLGAAIKLKGFYNAQNHLKPKTEIDFEIANLDIQQSFKTFNTVKKLAPIAENISGLFSTKLHLSTTLDKHLNVDYNTLLANGNLTIPKAEVGNVALLNKIAETLKNNKYKSASLNNVSINYKIENGKIHTEPFDINIGGQKLNLSGYTSVDQTINYTGLVNIPRNQLSAVNSALESGLAKLNKSAKSNINVSENIPIKLVLGGTFTKPTVSTNLAKLASDEAINIKNQLKGELDKQKKELEAKARAEADKLKQQAQNEADKAKKKAQDEADRIKRETEEKAKAEKDRLKKQAEEEAKKKLKGIFK